MVERCGEESPGTLEQHSPCKRTKGDLGIVQQKHTAQHPSEIDFVRSAEQIVSERCWVRVKSWGKSPRVPIVRWRGENPMWCKSDGPPPLSKMCEFTFPIGTKVLQSNIDRLDLNGGGSDA